MKQRWIVWISLAALLVSLIGGVPTFAQEGTGLININTADQAALTVLPGIGGAKAQAIVDYRQKNGPFKTIEDLKNVSGIGDKTFEDIKARITVADDKE